MERIKNTAALIQFDIDRLEPLAKRYEERKARHDKEQAIFPPNLKKAFLEEDPGVELAIKRQQLEALHNKHPVTFGITPKQSIAETIKEA